MLELFHLFSDGYDEWYWTKEEAYQEYKKMCENRENVRLYRNVYKNKKDYDNDDWCEEDCIESQGDFPM